MAVAQGVSQYSQAEATKSAVRSAYRTRTRQIDDSVANTNIERARAARRERARILAMAGEAGVGGNSVSTQLMDSRFQEGYDRTMNRPKVNGRSRPRGPQLRTNWLKSHRPLLLR